MRDYKYEIERAYESSLNGARCARCGRVISKDDRGWCKTILANPEKFELRHDLVPIRTSAYLCGKCLYEVSEDPKTYLRAEKEIFAMPVPSYEKTIRSELEKKDILPVLERIQFNLMDRSSLFCVRDMLTDGGFKCPYDPNKLSHSKCDGCLRNWLRSVAPKYKPASEITPNKNYKHQWTEEDKELLKYFGETKTTKELADMIGVTEDAVYCMKHKLKKEE